MLKTLVLGGRGFCDRVTIKTQPLERVVPNRPATDRSNAVDEILNGRGYVVFPGVLRASECQRARSRVLERAAREPRCENRQRIYGLLYDDPVFETTAAHPTVLNVIEAILGEQLRLGGLSAHVLHPGATPMGQHVDYPYWAMEPPYPASPVLEVQTIWAIDDFTEQNGAPRFVPESQRLCDWPDSEQFDRTAGNITAEAGSVIVSHGLCWHDTSPNPSDRSRVSVLGNYTPRFVQALEDLHYGFRRDRFERFSPTLKHLLRYECKPDGDPVYRL